ncbi:hypothetical protein PC0401_17640 [Streptococcus pneumoniae]|nr:hypothetical protein PC0401_17640 [Streptococcus pneumoniae]
MLQVFQSQALSPVSHKRTERFSDIQIEQSEGHFHQFLYKNSPEVENYSKLKLEQYNMDYK